jgi:hypothetical protein
LLWLIAVATHLFYKDDEANLDSDGTDTEGGGLIVYKALAPLSWRYQDYNAYSTGEGQRRVADLLRESDHAHVNIPYRQNRMVVFDGSLLHKT